MAYNSTYLQANQGTGSTSADATATLTTPGVGHLLYAWVGNTTAAVAYSGDVSDTVNGTWTMLESNIATVASQSIALYAIINTAATSSTVSASHLEGAALADKLYLNVYEQSGNPPSITGIVDVSNATGDNTVSSTGNSGVQPSITTTSADDLLLGGVMLNGTAGSAPSWTNTFIFGQENPSSTSWFLTDGYRIATTTGTYNPSVSWSNSRKFQAITTGLHAAPDVYVVQQTSGHATGVSSLATSAFGANTTTGNVILVLIDTIATGANSVTGVSDNHSNTYTKLLSYSPHFDQEVWICQNPTGGSATVITATISGSNLFSVFAMEINGLPTSGTILDATGTTQTTSTTATLSVSTSTATTNAVDLIIGFFSTFTGSSGTWTVGSGYSNFLQVNSTGDPSAIESMLTSSTGTQSASVTLPSGSQSVTGEGIIIALSNTAIVASSSKGNFLALM